ncbi:WXG100 family type VII secretion target [Streptomyces sp. NPDC056930]|uniref:WXG100 family type VII secretion target n=1 Tax=Streptomyces sp. NPDC056930 TaxID=3345967 RepID=UPI003627E829
MSSPFEDGVIHVDYNHMQNAADDLIQQTKAIDQTLTNLDAELQALMTHWEGDDSSEYKVCQQAWNQAVADMERMLNSHAVLLTDVSDNYKYTERSLAQMWADVKVQP